MDKFKLDGLTALVTGAAGGLGRAQVEALLAAGATVVATDRGMDLLEEAMPDQLKEHSNIALQSLDVTSVDSINAAVDRCREDFSGVDILVNNAGISVPGVALDYTMEDFDRTVDVNYRGVYRMCQIVGNSMKQRQAGGSIVNLASVGGQVVDGSRSSAYDGTKAAVIQITKNFAYELADYGIRVNAIAPGYIETEMSRIFLQDAEYVKDLTEKKIPMRRIGQPSEVASVVVFLASPAASYVNGHTLNVDGGWVIHIL